MIITALTEICFNAATFLSQVMTYFLTGVMLAR
jgi:hypothetical protein